MCIRDSVKAWRDGRKVFIEMSDNGPGVPAHARESLFRPFQACAFKIGRAKRVRG